MHGSRLWANHQHCKELQGHLTWWTLVRLAVLVLAGLLANAARAEEAVCAEVKIVIEQKLSLERQAFDAHMVLRNGLDASALSNVKVDLIFKDQDQKDVVATTDPNATGAAFFVRTDSLTGMSALDGSATLAPKTTADVRWLIIPSQGAGGNTSQGRLYYIGARVTYTLDGQTSSVDVTPDYVVVRPQPLLRLDYFLPTDVFADDPFTAEVEPPETFTLGVRVANVGAGAAYKTRIESAQPKIVENRQGLLIDFTILGGYVGNEMAGKSLLLDFGDIAPLTAKMGRWLMQTTLAGRFTAFDASFVHADSLGGAVTSLIKEVLTHRLVHDVRIDLPGRDGIDDFLAEHGDSYRVYDSEGDDSPVFNLSSSASLTALAGGNLSLRLPPTQGFVHVKLSDPGRGTQRPVQVIRSDGQSLLPQNFWLSRSRNQDLSWSYFIHVFDANPTGQYTLVMSGAQTARLSGQVYRDSNGNGVREAGEPAEGNLGIALKGIDTSGKSVVLQAYTDPSGEFSYASVPPGKYQLEAASRDGVVNGVWIAGSAGGKATPGLISDILLLAGSDGQGYVLSKRKSAAGAGGTSSADVSASIQSSAYQTRPGQSASVTVGVRNAGPSAAQGVSVQAAVPEGFTLQSSSASLGSFANGVWNVGALEKDQSATLTFNALAAAPSGGASRSIVWTATAGAQTADPMAGNNQARMSVLVQGDNEQVTLEQDVQAQARVLVWAACPLADASEKETCAKAKAQAARSWLAGKSHEGVATADLNEWRVAMRSGKYNLLWLNGGAVGLGATSLAEIRAAVRRGQTLVVDGAIASSVGHLSDVLGALPTDTSLGNALSVRLQGAGTAQPTVGKGYALEPQTAATLASYEASGLPAIAGHSFGHGQTLLAGFDLLDTATSPTHVGWSDYLHLQIKALTPAVRTAPALAGSSVPVRLVVRNPGATGTADKSVTLETRLSTGIQYDHVVPQPSTGAGNSTLNWSWALAAGQDRSASFVLTMPATSGQSQVVSRLLGAAAPNSGAEKVLPLTVLGLDAVVPRVGNALGAVAVATPEARALLDAAVNAHTLARDEQAQGRWSQSIDALAVLQAHVDALARAPHSLALVELQLDVARWMGLAQMRWTPEITEPPARLIAVGSGAQAAIVGQAFAQPLRARVLDRFGRPVGGVTVRFEVPVSGPAATLGGGTSVNVLTDADGLATSPALVANLFVGRYSASATVGGNVSPVSFALENLPAVSAPLMLQRVDGNNQTARVNALYGKPLSVRVVNAQNQPQSGIAVRFELPQMGASAQFEPGASAASFSVDVMTAQNGVAVSPAFRANAQTGAFVATASLPGSAAAGTQSFDLTNVADIGSASRFEATTPTGTGLFTATVSGGGASCTFNPHATRLLPAQGLGVALGSILLPHGAFDFELTGCTPGGEVTIVTTWPDLRGITGYLKYGVTPGSGGRKAWYPPANLRISGNTVTYTIRDGALGDDDLQANGVIRDPGGPVIMAAPASAQAIPSLDWRALILLSALLSVLAGGLGRFTQGRRPRMGEP